MASCQSEKERNMSYITKLDMPFSNFLILGKIIFYL